MTQRQKEERIEGRWNGKEQIWQGRDKNPKPPKIFSYNEVQGKYIFFNHYLSVAYRNSLIRQKGKRKQKYIS